MDLKEKQATNIQKETDVCLADNKDLKKNKIKKYLLNYKHLGIQ